MPAIAIEEVMHSIDLLLLRPVIYRTHAVDCGSARCTCGEEVRKFTVKVQTRPHDGHREMGELVVPYELSANQLQQYGLVHECPGNAPWREAIDAEQLKPVVDGTWSNAVQILIYLHVLGEIADRVIKRMPAGTGTGGSR